VDYIFFAKINNDGFSLTTNRNPIDKNDIPDIKSRIKKLDFSDQSKLKKIEIITGVFETFTIGKLTQGNTFITNGFISRVY